MTRDDVYKVLDGMTEGDKDDVLIAILLVLYPDFDFERSWATNLRLDASWSTAAIEQVAEILTDAGLRSE